MTEEDARSWVRDRFGVSRETKLAEYAALLVDEGQRQNLISTASMEAIWARHLVDSAQLLQLAEGARHGAWVDVGSGAGLPGIVIAILDPRPVILVEPRAKRADFLRRAAILLGIADQVSVIATRIEAWNPGTPAAIVSARAVAQFSALLSSTSHCTDSSTVWVLPKGQHAQSEVEAARRAWQGVFHVEPSITQPDSGIVVARKVRAR